MMNTRFAALMGPALIAGATTGLSAESGDAPPSASEFNPVQRYAVNYEKPEDVAEFYVRDYGLRARKSDFTRFVLQAGEGGWEAIEAGTRRKCHNGVNAGQWTRDVCP